MVEAGEIVAVHSFGERHDDVPCEREEGNFSAWGETPLPD